MKKILFTMLLVATGFLLKAQNVGIGTSTPTSKLHVVSTGNNTTPFSVFRSTGLTPLFRVIQGGVGNGNASIHNAAGDTVIQLSTSGDSWLMGGELGIGTNVPTSRLHVYSAGDNTIPLQVNKSGGLQLFRIMQGGFGNGAFSVHNSTGDTSVYITSNGNSWLLGGNLGIGTINPTNELTISGSSPAIQLQNTGVNKGFLQVSGDDLRLATNNGNTGNIYLRTSATDRLTVTSTGLVGIGTTSPTNDLTINGTDPAIQLQNANISKGFLQVSGDDLRLATNNGNTGNINLRTSGTDRLTVNSNGLVGIGTTTPSEKLDIVLGTSDDGGLRIGESTKKVAFLGDSTTTNENGVLRLFDNAQSETVRFGANTNSFLMGGFLGIGTTSPTNELTINSSSPAIQLQNSGVNKGFLSVSVDDLILATNSGNTGNINLKTSGTERLTVNSSGLIGIGTTTPNSTLTIRGLDPQIQLQGNSGADRGFLNLSGSDVKIGTNNGNTGKFIVRTDGEDRMAVLSNGNVGIGNTSPGNRLEVTGNTTGYVQHIENESYEGSGLVISIKSNNTYGSNNNFLGFRHWNGSNYYTNGCIEGFTYNGWGLTSVTNWCEVYDMIGIPGSIIDFLTAFGNAQIAAACMDDGVRYQSTGADYAEWLPREDPAKKILPASVVGVKNGKISYVTEGADQVMAISTRAVVLGNMPQDDKKADYETVAFIGQVHVWVQGNVNAGDYIVASGKNNGVAVAVSPDNITIDDMKNILGRSWETKKGEVNLVNTVVGLKTAEYAALMKKQIDKTKHLEEQMAKITAELNQVKESQAKDMEQIKKALNLNVRN